MSLDAVVQELTHGLTQFTAGLIYSHESGALNESFSDVFGALAERYVQGESANTWLIGEQIDTPGTAGDALRSMANPHLGGNITGIGADAAGRIWFRALTTYLTSSSNFAAVRTATLNAANDLYGASSTQSTAGARWAWAATAARHRQRAASCWAMAALKPASRPGSLPAPAAAPSPPSSWTMPR